MMIKIVTLFLIGMLVMAMFGRLKVPGSKRLSAARCSRCGRLRIGKSPCPCRGRG